ncbi:MAG: membrane protein insertase YidC [Betaproteobacteria bacterium]|nr:membrane protein insertase YidC [Betaproteobacteria bacterium]
MDIQRMVLVLIFAMSAVFLWTEWQRFTNPPPPVAQTAPATPAPAPVPGASDTLPTASVPSPAAAPATGAVPAAAPASGAAATGERITIETDLLRVVVNTAGGVIEEADLKTQQGTVDKNKPYQLLLNTTDRQHVVQAGLLAEGMPNHKTVYTAQPGARKLDGAESVQLRLSAPIAAGPAAGGKVDLVMTFKKGSYVVDVAFEITNADQAAVTPTAYFQLLRDNKMPAGESSMVPTYTGAAVYNEADKFRKTDWSDIEKKKAKLPAKSDNGWVAMIEHYFVAAILPPDKTEREVYADKVDALYRAGVKISAPAIAAGATGRIGVPVYLGPQEQEVLARTATGLDLVVDYGIFHVIAAPLFWLLSWLYKLVGNWGWAIILLTILIKGVFYPLNAASARSMAKLKLVAPKMKALQEQYANDKQQLQIKMMEMYKTEKINPLGGCLPILVQIPVFIALYWVLLGAVELRHAPWWGWIQDLSAPDPWYILPVLYAFTAWIQVKLQPPAPGMDPMQQKIMQFMPLMFSVMFIFFPAGLVLYWFVQNILTIAQQWHVNRMLEAEAKVKAATAAARR